MTLDEAKQKYLGRLVKVTEPDGYTGVGICTQITEGHTVSGTRWIRLYWTDTDRSIDYSNILHPETTVEIATFPS